ncbi:methyl-accepting chemotaxis protein [Sporomusaceae bacterium BoRhaA]|nr:methyl-accepting chemotaxis protein [Pelorhabdus rhamnosifermentans]
MRSFYGGVSGQSFVEMEEMSKVINGRQSVSMEQIVASSHALAKLAEDLQQMMRPFIIKCDILKITLTY